MFEDERKSLIPLPLVAMEAAKTVAALVNSDLTVKCRAFHLTVYGELSDMLS
jgi:hypothetical protein